MSVIGLETVREIRNKPKCPYYWSGTLAVQAGHLCASQPRGGLVPATRRALALRHQFCLVRVRKPAFHACANSLLMATEVAESISVHRLRAGQRQPAAPQLWEAVGTAEAPTHLLLGPLSPHSDRPG